MKRTIRILPIILLALASFNGLAQSKIVLRVGVGASADNNIAVVPTIADLRVYTGKATAVTVSESIRGGGFVLFPSSTPALTDDSGIIFHLDDGRWAIRQRTQTESLNFGWYGIADYNTGTGLGTDNRPAFIRCLNAAKSLGPNGTIYIQNGNYYFADSVGIKQNIRIHGVRGAVLYFASGKSGFVFWDADGPPGTSSSASATNSEIDHLTMNQKLPYVGGFGVKASTTVNIHDMTFNDWGLYAIMINAGSISSSIWDHIKRVMIANSGTLTSTVPSVTFGGAGTGAVGTAILGYKIASFTITDSGREYYSAPAVKVGSFGSLITEDNMETLGFGARASAVMGVDSVHMITGGSGYTTATVTFTGIDGGGVNATGTAVLSGGVVTKVIVNTRGSKYPTAGAVNVTITGNGTGATASATLLVVGMTLLDDGDLYEDSVNLFFTGGRHNTGHDAVGTANPAATGKVKRVDMISSGSGYDATSTVTFSNDTKGQMILFGDGLGNANRFKIENININRCLGGVWTEGGDANVGWIKEANAISCRGYGFIDNSFLGSHWISCHTELNLGSYMSTSNTAVQALFENCYGEGGQLPRVGLAPASMIGGDRGDLTAGSWKQPILSFTGNASESGTIEFTQNGPNSNQVIDIGGNTTEGTFFSARNSTTGPAFQANFDIIPSSGSYQMRYGPDQDKIGFVVTGPYTTRTFGHSAIQPFSMWIPALKVGEQGLIDSARGISNSRFKPTTGDFGIGDLVICRSNTNMANGIMGWLRMSQSNADQTNNTLGTDWMQIKSAAIKAPTVTAAGTTGAQTINNAIGSVNFAAGATSIVVTNNLIATTSLVFLTVMTNDATAKSASISAITSSNFTIRLNAAATAETKVAFRIEN